MTDDNLIALIREYFRAKDKFQIDIIYKLETKIRALVCANHVSAKDGRNRMEGQSESDAN